MTREEAKAIVKCFMENPLFSDIPKVCRAFDMAIKALEQQLILDKIRAEIFKEVINYSGTGEEVIQAYADGLKKGLDIIDKYKAESEV